MFIHRESEHLSLFYHPLLEDISCATSKKSVDLWYFCKGMVSHLKANYLEAAKYDKTRTEYLLENDYIFSPTDIIKSLNNYIYLLIDQKNFKEAFNYINIIDTYRDNANIKKALYLYFKHYLFLRACAFSGDNESLIPFVYDSLKQLVKWKKELNTTQQNEWYFNLVIALVQIKDYKEAIKVQNQWAIAEIMEYTILWRKIYRMICFYENESFILLNSEILSSVKALKRRNLQSQTIDILLNFFRHGAKHKKKMPYRKQELYLNLLELRKLPEEHKYFLELNLLNWAKT